MFTSVILIISSFLSIQIANSARVAKKRDVPPPSFPNIIGPKGLDSHDMTTCEEFSRFARFNPYSVLNDKWFAFYYWAPETDNFIFNFIVPTAKEKAFLRNHLEGHVSVPVNWTAKMLLMQDHVENRTHFLVEQGDRGQYLIYMIVKNRDGKKLDPMDIRFKQTSDNRYLGLLKCEENVMYVFSRMDDIPAKKDIQEAASRIGYRGRDGRSYLYQGHHWMPIPELDDRHYWLPPDFNKRRAFEYFDD